MVAADWADTTDGTWTDRPVNILVSVIGIPGRDKARRAGYEHDITKPVDQRCQLTTPRIRTASRRSASHRQMRLDLSDILAPPCFRYHGRMYDLIRIAAAVLTACTTLLQAQAIHTAERLEDAEPGVEAWRFDGIDQTVSCFAQIADHLWVGGVGGFLMHSRDGVTWTRVPTNDNATYRSIVHRPGDGLVILERFLPNVSEGSVWTFRVNPDGSPIEPLAFSNNADREQPQRTVSNIERIGERFWGRQISPADLYMSEDGLVWDRSNFQETAPTPMKRPKRVVMADSVAYLMSDAGSVYASQDGKTWTREIPPPEEKLFTDYHAAVFGRRIILAFSSRWGGAVHARTGDSPWADADLFEGRTVLGMAQHRGWALAHAREARQSGPGRFDPWVWSRHAFFISDDGHEWTEIAAPTDTNFRVDATDLGFFIGATGGRYYRVPLPDEAATPRAVEERLAFPGSPAPLRLRGRTQHPVDAEAGIAFAQSVMGGDAQSRLALLEELENLNGRFHRNTGVMLALLEGMGDEPDALYRRALLGVETGRLAGADLAGALERAYQAGSVQAGLDLANLLLDASREPTDAGRAAEIYERIAERTDLFGQQAAKGLSRARMEIAMGSTDQGVLTDLANQIIEAGDAAAAARLLQHMGPLVGDVGDAARRAFAGLGRIDGLNLNSLPESVRSELIRVRIDLGKVATDLEGVLDGVNAAQFRDNAAYRVLLERAGSMGHIEAMMALGDDYLGGLKDFPHDPAAAEQWYRKAGEAGDPRGARIAQSRDALGRPLPNRDDPIAGADADMLALLRELSGKTGPLSNEEFALLVRAAWKDGRYSDAGERLGIKILANRPIRVEAAAGDAFTFHRSFHDNRVVSAMLPGPMVNPQAATLFQVADQAETIGPIVFVLNFSEGDALEGRMLLAQSLGRAMMGAKQQNQPELVTNLLEAFRTLANRSSAEASETVRQGLLGAVEIIRAHDASLVNDETIKVLSDPEAWRGGAP